MFLVSNLKTLVIYDISSDEMRDKLREHLRSYGLRRIQYSGFIGDINPHDRQILAMEVGRFISCERDSIYIVPLCSRCVKLCKIISMKPASIIDEEEVEVV